MEPASFEHDSISPPSYDATQSSDLPAYTAGLPGASPNTTNLREYSHEVKGARKGQPAAELIFIAPAHLGKNIATYLTGSHIAGRIILNLTDPESIQEVALSIRGKILGVASGGEGKNEGTSFLEIQEKIWAPETTDSGKLSGRQEWTFSVLLPSEVSLPFGRGTEMRTFKLPETSRDHTLYHSISYEASLRVRRSRFKPDYRLTAQIGVFPRMKPTPASTLRQLAYQEQSPVLGPDADPEGWHALEPATVQGTMFGVRSISLKCTLFLAKPLSYTRGTVIPLNILVESEDEHAVDLLSSPEAVIVRLRRIVSHYPRKSTNTDRDAPSWKTFQDDYRPASFLPSPRSDSSQNAGFKRQMYGEVYLDKGMKPTTSILNIKIEYFVVLFPFKAAGFEASGAVDRLATVPVEIATLHATGPQARRYAPLRADDSTILTDRCLPISGFM